MTDNTAAVLAALPEGKGSRQRTPTIAQNAGIPLQDAVNVLLQLNADGTVGRMERDGRESWWKWPTAETTDETVESDQLDLLAGLPPAEPSTSAADGTSEHEAAAERLRELVAPFFAGQDTDDQIEALNTFRAVLAEFSPMQGEPVDYVRWVPADSVTANDYNPNAVAPPEMELLRLSIMADGYTQPIVAAQENGGWTVVDGFHRNRVGRECADVRERVHGYLPVVGIRADREDRGDKIASTIRHNRARGKHQVVAMSEIVLELKRRNWSDSKIGKELGMDPDEVLRLAQISGLAEAFKDRDFSRSWEAEIDDLDDETLSEIDEGADTMTSGLPGADQ